ncbi:mechanosensitive ion channel [Novosphingobium sp. YJ-S2-02]|uniref:Mechanosensitive ion channel n=1 Tax=Novosphingobium aureum TaxID=2792964 RepID=A0A931HFN7_9SPHN|nr:mechanosensitive ion channel domain-containing protein [Novosphingobium aureum]MBH0114962.1 mechanosensitive ion channel [Novosphingobium aureum]
MDAGAEEALLTFLGYLGMRLVAVIAIATTGLNLSSLAFVVGALSVGLGFELQSVVENFTSGILLLIERPIKVGDWIEVGEHSGIVRRIAVRSTHVETFDRHQIIIPNSQLISGVVKNRSFTSGPSRIVVPVGVAYGSDLDRVGKVLLEIAHEIPGVLSFPEPVYVMDGFGDSSINVKILAFMGDALEAAPVLSACNLEIARRFAREGIEIPFPQRDLHLRTWLEQSAPTDYSSQIATG